MTSSERKPRILMYITLLLCFQAGEGFWNALRVKREASDEKSNELETLSKTSAKSRRDQFQGKLIVESKWEQAVMAAPMAVSFIGQLVLLSTENDFDLYLDKNINVTYKILRHSKFKPAMIQLGTEAYSSFNVGQKNTERMSELMEQIPRQTKEVMKLLVSAKAKLLQRMLPIPLKLMEKATEESMDLATETEEAFVRTMYFLQELSEVIVATDSENEMIIEKNRQEKMILDVTLARLNDTKKEQEKYLDEITKQLKENQKAFDKAIKDIPTGWKAVGQNFFAKLDPTKIISEVSKVFTSVMAGPGMIGKTPAQRDVLMQKVTKQVVGKQMSITQCGNLVSEVNKMVSTMKAVKVSKGNESESSASLQETLTGNFKMISVMVNKYKEQLKDMEPSKAKTKAEQVFKEAVAVANKAKSDLSKGAADIFKYAKSHLNIFDGVLSSAKSIVAMGTAASGQVPMQTKNAASGKKEFVVGENEKFIAAQQKELLLDSRARADERFNQIQKINEDVTRNMEKLSRLNFQTIDAEDIRKIIKEAVGQLTMLKDYWTTLVNFFQSLATAVHVALNYGVNAFKEYANQTGEAIIAAEDEKAVTLSTMKDMLFSNAVQILTVARSVYVVTSTYHNISKEYVSHQINNQIRFSVMDKKELKEAKLGLLHNSTQIGKKILAIVKIQKENYKTAIEKRLKQIEQIFSVVGTPSSKETKQVKESMQKLSDLDDYY